MTMTTKLACGSCRFWTFTRLQDSGIKQPNGTDQWLYRMGTCALALDNAPDPEGYCQTHKTNHRFGKYPALGSPEHPETPEWSSCWYGKPRTKKAAVPVSRKVTGMTIEEQRADFQEHVDRLFDGDALADFARTVGVAQPAQLVLEPISCYLGVIAQGNPAWTVM